MASGLPTSGFISGLALPVPLAGLILPCPSSIHHWLAGRVRVRARPGQPRHFRVCIWPSGGLRLASDLLASSSDRTGPGTWLRRLRLASGLVGPSFFRVFGLLLLAGPLLQTGWLLGGPHPSTVGFGTGLGPSSGSGLLLDLDGPGLRARAFPLSSPGLSLPGLVIILVWASLVPACPCR